jgi:hypothetical protein
MHTQREQVSSTIGRSLSNPVFAREQEVLRWSKFKNIDPQQMYERVRDQVFPFIKNLHAADSTFAQYMKVCWCTADWAFGWRHAVCTRGSFPGRVICIVTKWSSILSNSRRWSSVFYAPGVFSVERHIRGKWVCDNCETLIQAPVPAHVIDNGMPHASLRT